MSKKVYLIIHSSWVEKKKDFIPELNISSDKKGNDNAWKQITVEEIGELMKEIWEEYI